MLFVRIVKASGGVFKGQLSCSRKGYLKVNKTNIAALKWTATRTGDIYDVVALVDVCIAPKDVLRNHLGHTSPKYLGGIEVYKRC